MELNEFNKPYHFIRDNYTGGGGYSRFNEYSYLIPFERELKPFYKDRKNNAVLENLYQPLQDLFIEPIISQAIKVQTNNKNLSNVVEESEVIPNANAALIDFKIYGKTFFSVSTSIDEDGVADLRSYPDIEVVFPGDIISLVMSGTKIASSEYTEYIEYMDVDVPVLISYKNNIFTKKTLAWYDGASGKVTLKDQGEKLRLRVFDGSSYGVFSKIGTKLSDIPRSFNLAQIQKQLFNLDSQRLDTLRKNGWPLLVMQTDDAVGKISLSNNTILKVPNTVNNLPEYLEAGLEGVEMTGTIMEEKKSTIYKVFTNGLFSDNIKYTSTMSSLIATRSFTGAVNTFYEVYKNILYTINNSILFIYDLNTSYNIDFPELNLKEEELQEQAQDHLS